MRAMSVLSVQWADLACDSAWSSQAIIPSAIDEIFFTSYRSPEAPHSDPPTIRPGGITVPMACPEGVEVSLGMC